MKLPAPVAAVIAKTDAAGDLHPFVFGAVVILGGVLLIYSGLSRRQGL